MKTSMNPANIERKLIPLQTISDGVASTWMSTGTKQDLELAAVPFTYLLHCIQCGIAPAMRVDGERSYLGADFDEETDENTKVLLGKQRAPEGRNRCR